MFNIHSHFVKCGFRMHSLLIVVYCRPGDVRRDQDGEREVKGLWNGEIRLSRKRWEGVQDDEWNQDQRPRGGRPHRSERLELL